MTSKLIQGFRRVGGKSAQNIAQDVAQRLKDEAPEAKLRTLGPGELTAELWSDLQGTWVGNKGWNIIAVPSPGSTPEGTGDFRLLVAPYMETLTFTSAGAPARNRGGSVDQFVPALEYHQRVSDKNNGELLHVENGMFLNLSQIVNNEGQQQPLPEFNIARSGTIPHGDSITILGKPPFVENGRPQIPAISSRPPDTGDATPLGYLDPYHIPRDGIDVGNPNATLIHELDVQSDLGLEISKTTTMILDSNNSGSVYNIPYVVKHANATRMQAVFWLEKVVDKKTGQQFDQLQYTQIIDLAFHHKFTDDPATAELITWPHITINTMIKQ